MIKVGQLRVANSCGGPWTAAERACLLDYCESDEGGVILIGNFSQLYYGAGEAALR
jgi:hypothetical protein